MDLEKEDDQFTVTIEDAKPPGCVDEAPHSGDKTSHEQADIPGSVDNPTKGFYSTSQIANNDLLNKYPLHSFYS